MHNVLYILLEDSSDIEEDEDNSGEDTLMLCGFQVNMKQTKDGAYKLVARMCGRLGRRVVKKFPDFKNIFWGVRIEIYIHW